MAGNENPGIDGRAAYAILISKLAIRKSMLQIFTDSLIFNVHKFTFLCKPISGRDKQKLMLNSSSPNCSKPNVSGSGFSVVQLQKLKA